MPCGGLNYAPVRIVTSEASSEKFSDRFIREALPLRTIWASAAGSMQMLNFE
jgi:hypothetical protein